MRQSLSLATALLLASASPGFAQSDAAPSPLEYAFDDEQVRGDTLSPHAEIFTSRRVRPGKSLIDLRTTFVAELTKSVEDL